MGTPRTTSALVASRSLTRATRSRAPHRAPQHALLPPEVQTTAGAVPLLWVPQQQGRESCAGAWWRRTAPSHHRRGQSLPSLFAASSCGKGSAGRDRPTDPAPHREHVCGVSEPTASPALAEEPHVVRLCQGSSFPQAPDGFSPSLSELRVEETLANRDLGKRRIHQREQLRPIWEGRPAGRGGGAALRVREQRGCVELRLAGTRKEPGVGGKN